MKFNYWRILLLGFGFMGVSLLWGIYNAYVPIFLQAGRPDYSTTAGVNGFGMSAGWTGFIMTLDNCQRSFKNVPISVVKSVPVYVSVFQVNVSVFLLFPVRVC